MSNGNLFIDIDTLGLAENSILLSIAMLYIPGNSSYDEMTYEQLYKKGLEIRLDKYTQSNHRTYDNNTAEYWRNKCHDMILIKKTDVNNSELLGIINSYLNFYKFDKKTDKIWSNRLIDFRFWESYFNMYFSGFENPFPHYAWRDTRTAFDILTGDPKAEDLCDVSVSNYSTLSNCVIDYMKLRSALAKFE